MQPPEVLSPTRTDFDAAVKFRVGTIAPPPIKSSDELPVGLVVDMLYVDPLHMPLVRMVNSYWVPIKSPDMVRDWTLVVLVSKATQ